MLKVGLTGGIAAGKSIVGGMLVDLGAHLVEADRIAHSLMQPGEPVYHEVVRHFGCEILNSDGSVNRGKLAEMAFGPAGSDQRSSRIGELNRIVHPAVICSQEEWMDAVGLQDPGGIAVVEAALLIEAGAAKRFDRVIVVTCKTDQRAERFAARHKIDLDTARKEVSRRMAAQFSDAEKIKFADSVIDNSGTLESTRQQVQAVWQKLVALR
jgi:dephospho-CoA kinase